ncbi:Holliday junction resolvase RuvX [Kaistia dalseonensis]|uniref:Putative pre-16S rRNA nuclease n=1 Tax=Kaistia dalseonensis TaxID=410840 RepID=A0ABU0H6T2_9HYPH|nr:Holliday junction resolvase RuvX [Kaistia dalseonensis]MCX5495429.1 Holliday junction resolvase RuvX [Kaistia dalseonensis]MDQ0438018.1 putative Holliday junction resolvase [Kaistia dalseonensis]
MAGTNVTLAELSLTLPPAAALIGLDLGTKTIGVAISDLSRNIASPLVLINRQKFTVDVEALLKIIATHRIAAIIIGLPLNMDGSEGPRAQATRAFVRNMLPKIEIPVAYWDERLSTVAVTRTLIEADTSRKRRGELVDKMAAAFILQGALDRLGRIERDRDEEAD